MRANDFYIRFGIILMLGLVLAACGGAGEGEETAVTAPPTNTPQPTAPQFPTETPAPTDTAVPTATSVPTDTAVPTATAVPTETPVPTATPQPIEVTEELADDGCSLVNLSPEAWSPLFAAYKGGGDPFYHIHTNEDDFFFNVELYTVYGSGWTGQLGVFPPNCNGSGICVYLVPDAVNPYWATAGDVDIISLAEQSGVISGTVEIEMSNLTMQPVPGTNSPGCYHIDEVTILVTE